MVRVLSVAEKNDAAKNIAAFLSRGGNTWANGRSKYNKIYQFPFTLNGQQVQMHFTSVSGHVLDSDFGPPHRGWRSCPPSELFHAPLVDKMSDSARLVAETLEKEARFAQTLIIWTDCDREGENIGAQIRSICTKINPRLQVLRARFSEITSQSVHRAINNLVTLDERVAAAVDCRKELDLRIGAAFTRLQSLYLQSVFPQQLEDGAGKNRLVSYGSCQFPTLGFVVERYKAAKAFQPEPFWKLALSHEKAGQKTDFAWSRKRLFERAPVDIMKDMCESIGQAEVTSVKTKPKNRWRPVPLDTVELEKLAVRKLRLSARNCMTAAERLYTKGIISYPRTETNIFPPNIDLSTFVQQQLGDTRWSHFAQRVLEDDERRVYELVVRHFLACVSRDAIGRETVVEVQCGAEQFYANGLIIDDMGFLEVYTYDRWSAKTIPPYANNEVLSPVQMSVSEGQTSAPALLSEADLIALMEKHGIGTDATHAEHIETIQQRLYVKLGEDRRFTPGFLGLGLVDGYDAMGYSMSKPHLRAALEADLKLICEGRKRKDDVLREQIQKYAEVFRVAEQNIEELRRALNKYWGANRGPGGGNLPGNTVATAPGGGPPGPPPPPPPGAANLMASGNTQVWDALANIQQPPMDGVARCPQCQAPVKLRKVRATGNYFLGCSKYPDCKGTRNVPNDGLESIEVAPQRCIQCRPEIRKATVKFKRGKRPANFRTNTYTGCLECDPQLVSWLTGTTATSSPHTAATQQLPVANTAGTGPNPQRTAGRSSAGAPPDTAAPRPLCRCGAESLPFETRKAGPNQGRWFYRCPNMREPDKDCQFFQWMDEPRPGDSSAPTSVRADGSTPPPTAPGARSAVAPRRNATLMPPANAPMQTQNRFNRPFSTSASAAVPAISTEAENTEAVQCNCGVAVAPRTVRKVGPNTGRQFYTCPTCSFFKWADDGSTKTPVAQPSTSRADFPSARPTYPTQPARIENDSEASNVPRCECQQPARELTVRKEGPNTGRKFYKCSNPSNGCNFFQWADQINPTAQPAPPRESNRRVTQPPTAGASQRDSRTLATGSQLQIDQFVDQVPKCQCNKSCSLKTVGKPGHNMGKKFWSCQMVNQRGGCKFFVWA